MEKYGPSSKLRYEQIHGFPKKRNQHWSMVDSPPRFRESPAADAHSNSTMATFVCRAYGDLMILRVEQQQLSPF